jgi:hypothetical protein
VGNNIVSGACAGLKDGKIVGKLDAELCYREAEDCQREAAKTKEASDREFWRRLAAE